MSMPRILVAGIGNIFLGDDAFGVEVVRGLSRRALPDYVRVVDYGIRGLDLAYALMDDYDLAILVDAAGRGGEPGTLYVLEPELSDAEAAETRAVAMEAHGLNPMLVLEMVRAMGGRPRQVLVVGCEPATLGDEFEGAMGLSPAVEAAVAGAIAIVESLIARVAQHHAAKLVA
ncbi:MAG TPA: hydrogenase maturation protease [Bryobacteraceae bacterium]|jgi:hydrogenase maturation protease|nr:hydrogenase maturation protease [Bryobacteraceae bacterium]